jgi:hypothetical protein
MRTLLSGAAAVLALSLLAACGTPSEDSRYQLRNGTAPNGYPMGKPNDAESPALSSTTETKYSRSQVEIEQPSKKDQPSPNAEPSEK